jgi:hypothetical protein
MRVPAVQLILLHLNIARAEKSQMYSASGLPKLWLEANNS